MSQQCFLNKKKRGVDVRRFHPFERMTKVLNRSYSKRCEKLITDFGIEESFGAAANRMQEHHGVDINVSAVRAITEKHAKRAGEVMSHLPEEENPPTQQAIMEMDGEMIPLVEYEESADCRKKKRNFWSELRVGAVQRSKELEWKYAVSFNSPDELGYRLSEVAKKIGFNEETKVHGVGDGALWIAEQGEKIAGRNYTHLIDLFHLCEYFGKAVRAWCSEEEVKQEVERLKNVAVERGIEEVVIDLNKYLISCPKHEGLLKCLKYISNRPGQFKYKQAKENGFPMGSGKIESTHRHLMQKRLKKPGAWWKKENAANMANLRALRANGGWRLLWQEKNHQDEALLAA